jgi:hypothetical protein
MTAEESYPISFGIELFYVKLKIYEIEMSRECDVSGIISILLSGSVPSFEVGYIDLQYP